jgi:hypothetical protein
MLVAVAAVQRLVLAGRAGQALGVTAPQDQVLQRLELQIVEEEAAVSDIPPRVATAVPESLSSNTPTPSQYQTPAA